MARRVLGGVLYGATEGGQRLGTVAELQVKLAELRALLRVPGMEREAILENSDHSLQLRVAHGLVRVCRSRAGASSPLARGPEPSANEAIIGYSLQIASTRLRISPAPMAFPCPKASTSNVLTGTLRALLDLAQRTLARQKLPSPIWTRFSGRHARPAPRQA